MANIYSRYVWLVNVLLAKKRCTLEQLSRAWERSGLYDNKPLTRRTFCNHRDAVQDLFNINIECDKHDGYKYYILEGEDITHNGFQQWMLNSFSVTSMTQEAQQVRNRMVFERTPGGTQHLPLVVNAMRDNHTMRIDYKKFTDAVAAEHIIDPYFLKVYKQKWYVLAYDHNHDELRHFALDRITNLQILDETFVLPRDFTAEDYYRHSVGIWINDTDDEQRVVLRAYGKEPNFLRTLPLHQSQREIATTAEYADFEYTIYVNDELLMALLERGNNIEILEPQILRNKMRTELERMLSKYK